MLYPTCPQANTPHSAFYPIKLMQCDVCITGAAYKLTMTPPKKTWLFWLPPKCAVIHGMLKLTVRRPVLPMPPNRTRNGLLFSWKLLSSSCSGLSQGGSHAMVRYLQSKYICM